MDMEKTYTPENFESSTYQKWEKEGFFKPSYDESKDSYSIALPPPNVPVHYTWVTLSSRPSRIP